jgi:hypothetical protein
MAGFETIVRPVVLPNIRPTPKQSVRPQEAVTGDPEKGMCVIRGTSGKIVQLPYSFSSSMSKSQPVEIERRFDEGRVYQKEPDGKVNKENFVDIEIPTRIKMRMGGMGQRGPGTPGITGPSPGKGDSTEIAMWYAREIERENLEILKRDQIRKNKEETGE